MGGGGSHGKKCNFPPSNSYKDGLTAYFIYSSIGKNILRTI